VNASVAVNLAQLTVDDFQVTRLGFRLRSAGVATFTFHPDGLHLGQVASSRLWTAVCASADLFTAFSSEVGAAVIDDAGVDPAGMRPQHPAGHLAVHRQ